MSDQQPLLSTSNKSSLNDNDNKTKKRHSDNSLSDWRQFFSGKDNNDQYKKLDDDIEQTDNGEVIGILHLFRFTDRIDYLLLFIATCFCVISAICFLINLILFGRITGMFAIESFGGSCHHRYQHLFKNNHTCPLGIDLNSFNYVRFHNLCHHNDDILSSTPTASIPKLRRKIMPLIYLLLISGTVDFLCSSISKFIWTTSAKRQASRMSVSLFQSLIQRVSHENLNDSENIPYLDKNPPSDLHATLFDNIRKIEHGIGHDFLVMFQVLLFIIGSFIISFVFNWQLSLIMICILPLVLGASFLFSKLTANEAIKDLTTYSKAEQIVQEVFSSLRTVLSLNGSKFEQKRYETKLQSTRTGTIRQGALYGAFSGWVHLINYIVHAVGFIFGSILMSHENPGAPSLTDILIIVSIFAQTMTFFGFMGPYFQSVSETRGAAVSVFRLIDEVQNININETDVCKEDKIDEETMSNINGDIEFDNVSFLYPSRKDVPVLNNITLIAPVGQTIALVGSSGCGKSTCISLLLRYYEPSSGQITINGRSLTDYNLRQLRQNIGVVSQEPILFGMTIYENIRFGKLNATRTEIEEAAQQANAHNFIMKLPDKYETLVGERGIQLSGGEKQRIALARALIKNPTLLLLDEATSALDNTSEKIVQEALDRACKDRTTIVIAHRLSTIQNAHQIYVLDKGSVVEQGTHETLMAKEGGKYQSMVKSQQMERTHDDKDDIINMEKAIEEDEKPFFERLRSLSVSEAIDMNETSKNSSKRQSIFLRLLSMNSPEWMTLLIGCIVCLMVGGLQPIYAVLLAKIVYAFEDCVHSDRLRQVLLFGLLFLLVGIIGWALRFFQFTAFAISGSKLTQRIRSKAFSCLLRQEVAYFDRPENSSGAICIRLSSEATAIQEMAGTRLGVICEGFGLSCFGLIFGIFVSWQLTIIVFICFLIVGVVIYWDVRLTIWVNQRSAVILGNTSSLAVEVLHNMRTIKQLSVEKEVSRQYTELIDKIFTIFWKPFIFSCLAYGVFMGINTYVLALLYWCALILIEKNELPLKDVIIVFGFAAFSLHAIYAVAMMSRRVGASLSAAQTFFNLFDRTPAIDNSSTEGQELVNFRGEIELDQVNFVYPARPASLVLNNIQLTVKSGQRVALVGASGCGKSTVIQLLERFYDATSGQLLLDGINIRQLNIHWVRSRFGLVSQEPILFDLTIAENIAYGLENVPVEAIIDATTKANIHQFIQQLPQGYETKVGTKGSFLSGGEKQRIAIARVLLRRPKVLLLDEATSAMDSHNEQIVQQTLEEAQREDPSRTSLIIAHRLSTIQSCDVIYVVDKGHIVESGTHTELVQRRGTYYRMLNQNNV